MKINEILVEGPFDSMKAAQSTRAAVPSHIAAAQKAGTKSGILKGLDQWAGTNAFGSNKTRPVADLEDEFDSLDDASKKALLIKLQQKIGQSTASQPAKPTAQPAAPTTKP
jgi:hypothetical protein